MYISLTTSLIFAVLILLLGIAIGWFLRSRSSNLKFEEKFQAALKDSFKRETDADNDHPFAFAGVDRIHADCIKIRLSSIFLDPKRFQVDNEGLSIMVGSYLKSGAIYPAAYAIKIAELRMNNMFR